MQRRGLIVIVATLGLVLGSTGPAEAGGGKAFDGIDTNNDKKIDLKETRWTQAEMATLTRTN